LRSYELIYIISPEAEDEQVESVVERVSQLVTSRDGTVVETNPWGRRKMAYSIRSFSEGNYILSKIELDPDKVKEIEAVLGLDEDIIRHLVVRLDD
jgi:small subunit ribosomal protein S6